jgi:phage terminase large subunit-like protein
MLDQKLQSLLDSGKDREYAHYLRVLCKNDLYALLRYVLSPREWKDKETGLPFWNKQWLIDRCRDAQFDNHDVLDVWSRFHCKSTIKTFALTIFELIQNPNETIGIFSITKGNAEGFVMQIKTELEQNEMLKSLFPDVFYWDPAKESTLWSLQKGFNVKRTSNTNTANVEPQGLVDSNYAGKRYSIQKYDDVVTEASVTSPDMVEKTTQGWELSMGTGMPGTRRQYTGTFYAYGDTYHTIVERGIKLRLHPCYEVDYDKSTFDKSTGLPLELHYFDDKPSLFGGEFLRELAASMGPITFGCQLLCNPSAGLVSGFKLEWFRTYTGETWDVARDRPRVILVDSANEKKKGSDYTCMWVVALSDNGIAYIVDGIRDRLNLRERTDALFDLHQRWKPLEVRYERYGMMVDVEHIREVMNQRHYHFDIIEVKGNTKKDDRIARLVPWFNAGRVYFPATLPYVNYEMEEVDLTEQFLKEEFLKWPTGIFKDMLDSLARLREPDHPLPWPSDREAQKKADTLKWRRQFARRRNSTMSQKGDWQAAC